MSIELRQDAGSVIFRVKAIPNAKKPGIAGIINGALKVKVSSPPERGRANAEITQLLSKELGVKEKEVEIIKGQISRDKTVKISGIAAADIIKISEDIK